MSNTFMGSMLSALIAILARLSVLYFSLCARLEALFLERALAAFRRVAAHASHTRLA
jgi:hypothetical protein